MREAASRSGFGGARVVCLNLDIGLRISSAATLQFNISRPLHPSQPEPTGCNLTLDGAESFNGLFPPSHPPTANTYRGFNRVTNDSGATSNSSVKNTPIQSRTIRH